jgi:hypothetical protein
MRVVDDATGTESADRIDLDLELLNDPLSLFRTRNFPNGHYRIYLEEVRTRRVRLILDVHIFNGKVVPPNYREGAAEKQPGTEQLPVPNAAVPAQPGANQNGALQFDASDHNVAELNSLPAARWGRSPDRATERSEFVAGRYPQGLEAALSDAPRTMTRVARLWRKLNHPA